MDVEKLDQVCTRDRQHLGVVPRLYHRTNDVQLGWQHYATSILVQSFAQDDDFYSPTDFVTGRDPQTGHITLTVTEKNVEKKTWTRLPEFVLHGGAASKELWDRVQNGN